MATAAVAESTGALERVTERPERRRRSVDAGSTGAPRLVTPAPPRSCQFCGGTVRGRIVSHVERAREREREIRCATSRADDRRIACEKGHGEKEQESEQERERSGRAARVAIAEEIVSGRCDKCAATQRYRGIPCICASSRRFDTRERQRAETTRGRGGWRRATTLRARSRGKTTAVC